VVRPKDTHPRLDQAYTHHGMRNSPDYNEMVLRYGASTSFARRPADHPAILEHEINVIGLEPKPAYPFFGKAEQGEWPPDPEKPRSRFATTLFAKSMGSIANVQFARFRRNDSIIVVAGFSAKLDTLFNSDAVGATLSVSAGPNSPTVSARAPAHGGHGAVAVRALVGGIGSIEVTDSVHRRGRSSASPSIRRRVPFPTCSSPFPETRCPNHSKQR
jgi:hypothetical protein